MLNQGLLRASPSLDSLSETQDQVQTVRCYSCSHQPARGRSCGYDIVCGNEQHFFIAPQWNMGSPRRGWKLINEGLIDLNSLMSMKDDGEGMNLLLRAGRASDLGKYAHEAAWSDHKPVNCFILLKLLQTSMHLLRLVPCSSIGILLGNANSFPLFSYSGSAEAFISVPIFIKVGSAREEAQTSFAVLEDQRRLTS